MNYYQDALCVKKDMKLCNYGCGQKATHKFKNGKYCCNKLTCKCPNIRKINSEKNLGENNGMYGKKHSTETKRKIGLKSKEKIFDDDYKEKLRKNMIGNQRRKGIKHTQETKNRISKSLKGRKLSKKNKEGISKALKGRIFTKEWRKKLSCAAIQKFKNEEFQKQFKKSINQKPTSIEKIINKLVCEYNFKYVGDFSLWIDGRNPDFINKKDKKIIEVFGDYWHEPEDEYKKYVHFKNNGYKLLVIWEHEIFENFENVKKRFYKFLCK